MKLLELRLLPESNRPVKAFADVQLNDGTVIREFRVVKEPNKRPSVACPQVAWKDPRDGRLKYTVIVTLPQPVKVEVDMLVLGAWLKERENRSGSSGQPA
jgi:hypothetical protein